MSEPGRAVSADMELERVALEAARVLARAIGESPAFRAFEAARDALFADRELSRRLRDLQARQRELAPLRAWGGVDPAAEQALEAEWRSLCEARAVRAYLESQEELTRLFVEIAGVVSQEIGMDFAAACAPAGGCCA